VDNTKKYGNKLIYTASLARYLLHCGFMLVDFKEDYKNKNRTVFYFKNSAGLEQAIEIALNKKRDVYRKKVACNK